MLLRSVAGPMVVVTGSRPATAYIDHRLCQLSTLDLRDERDNPGHERGEIAEQVWAAASGEDPQGTEKISAGGMARAVRGQRSE